MKQVSQTQLMKLKRPLSISVIRDSGASLILTASANRIIEEKRSIMLNIVGLTFIKALMAKLVPPSQPHILQILWALVDFQIVIFRTDPKM